MKLLYVPEKLHAKHCVSIDSLIAHLHDERVRIAEQVGVLPFMSMKERNGMEHEPVVYLRIINMLKQVKENMDKERITRNSLANEEKEQQAT